MDIQRQKLRSYTYRIPLDDRRAIRKIHKLQSLETGYDIMELSRHDVPNYTSVQHWAHKFYESNELRDFETGEKTGGTIPGLHKYRYSLDWKPMPHTSSLEMRHANGGGTRIRGQEYVGTSDPHIPNYLMVNFTVPWTPDEIRDIFSGNPVPDKDNYHHNPPKIPAEEAHQQFSRMLDMAKEDAIDEAREKLLEYRNNCDHNHVVTTGTTYGAVAFCEDCYNEWYDEEELTANQEAGELTIVGEV